MLSRLGLDPPSACKVEPLGIVLVGILHYLAAYNWEDKAQSQYDSSHLGKSGGSMLE